MWRVANDASPVPLPEPPIEWRFATKVAFRYAFCYFGLYVICTQMIRGLVLVPTWSAPDLGTVPPMSTLVMWVIRHVFHDHRALAMAGGSGDKMFDWVQALCLLLIAAVLTCLWSVVDRRRANYARLHRWFRVFLRFALGSTLISYGADKVIPLQMPFPSLTRLLEPYGNFSPMSVLWYSIGASPGYEIFAGSCEAIGGILLFFPRTALLGAMICLVDVVEVFTLNMTYDVPVKLFALHLILLALLLVAPDARRIAGVFLSTRTIGPPASRALFASNLGNWIATGLVAALGLTLAGMNVYRSSQGWRQYGGGVAKPSLYGIWIVDPTSSSAWKHVVFESNGIMSFERPDDSFATYRATINEKAGAIALGTSAGSGTLKYQRSGNDLTLDGKAGSQDIHLRAHLFD